jgi:hypothetical protein
MASVEVLGGDIQKGKWNLVAVFGQCSMTMANPKDMFKPFELNLNKEVQSVEMMDEEKLKKLGGTAAWGLAGALVLGPLGAIGGMLLGGNKKEVTFACHLKDGRKFLATTDSKSWHKIAGLTFDAEVTVPAVSTPAGEDAIASLERLAKLKEQGALSEEEFAMAKQRVLEA